MTLVAFLGHIHHHLHSGGPPCQSTPLPAVLVTATRRLLRVRAAHGVLRRPAGQLVPPAVASVVVAPTRARRLGGALAAARSEVRRVRLVTVRQAARAAGAVGLVGPLQAVRPERPGLLATGAVRPRDRPRGTTRVQPQRGQVPAARTQHVPGRPAAVRVGVLRGPVRRTAGTPLPDARGGHPARPPADRPEALRVPRRPAGDPPPGRGGHVTPGPRARTIGHEQTHRQPVHNGPMRARQAEVAG